jgi:hypothetical protein
MSPIHLTEPYYPEPTLRAVLYKPTSHLSIDMRLSQIKTLDQEAKHAPLGLFFCPEKQYTPTSHAMTASL